MKARKKKAAQRAAKRTTEMKEKIATNAEHKKAEVVDSTEKTTAAKNTTKKEVELLRDELGEEYSTYFANKFSRPFIPDVIKTMENDGIETGTGKRRGKAGS